MKNIRAAEVLLFISLLCLLWLPNYCDIKQDDSNSQGIQAHKAVSSDPSRIGNVPSEQEKTLENANLGLEISNNENPVQPNVEYVNNPEIKDTRQFIDLSETSKPFKVDASAEKLKKQTVADLESSRHISINEAKPTPLVKNKISLESEGKSESVDIPVKMPKLNEQLSSSKVEQSIVKNTDKLHTVSAAPDSVAIDSVMSSPVIVEAKQLHPRVSLAESDKFEESSHQHPHYDGMPSFDEWKKMMLAEQEKGGQKMPSPSPPGKKISSQKRRRNYSSYECGAKIVASNPEAEGTSRILNELVDEYMLNPCKTKIWFVIELCETVQASQIELANFELFSSCPKDFVVYSSDNFPTRDWVVLGTFTAAEQRVLQSFELKQEGFGKFIKIELLSHYGEEHYCPLSVVRIFGTSMVDEYEEMETLASLPDVHEDELDRLDIPAEDKKATNIFGSATDAVMNIVKKAAQALGQHQPLEDGQTNDTAADPQNVSETKYCKLIDSSPEKCEEVPIKTKNKPLHGLLDISVPPSSMHQSLFRLLHRCDQCVSSHIRYYSSAQPHCRFFQAALGPVVFQALCDWFKEHPFVISHESPTQREKNGLSGDSFIISPTKSPPPQIMRVHSDSDLSLKTVVINDSISSLTDSDAGLIVNVTHISLDRLNKSTFSEGTKLESSIQSTLPLQSDQIVSPNDSKIAAPVEETTKLTPSPDAVSEFVTKATVTVPEKTDISISKSVTDTVAPSVSGSEFVVNELLTDTEEEQINEFLSETSTMSPDDTTLGETIVVTELPSSFKSGEDKLLDMRNDLQGKPEAIVSSAGTTAGQKESVFMRMSNRIKALEINMSLSSQYLQELSQRYRRQMEEMQRAFNRTVGTLNDTARKAAEKDLKQQEILNNLQLQVANLSETVELLLTERSSVFRQMIETHVCLMLVEAIIMITIMSLCVRRITSSAQQIPPLEKAPIVSPPRLSKRRSSADSCSPPIARKVKKRSNSEDNLNAAEDVVIVEPLTVLLEPGLKAKKKHRKRNRAIQRSISHPMVSQKSSTSQCTENQHSHSEGCMVMAIKSKQQLHKDNQACENCNYNKCSVKIPVKEKRLNAFPLQNLTNGTIVTTQPRSNSLNNKGKVQFSLKKFLKFQKRDSI